jgi:hypothetical protein
MSRVATRVAGPLLLYGAVVCWLTWPLATRLATHLPSTSIASAFDPLYTAWVLAWEAHALGGAARSILDANIYHPAPHALLYGPPALGALPYFAAVYTPTGNPTLALNVLFLGSAVLGATAVHVVTRRWTGRDAAGAVAGCTFLASRWLFWNFAVTSPQFAMVFYLPFIVERLCAPPRNRRGIATLFLLVFAQSAVDIVYLAPATLAPTLVIAGARLARRRTRADGLIVVATVALVALALAALHWPWLAFARATATLSNQSLWIAEKHRVFELPWCLMSWLSPVAMPSVVLVMIVLGAARVVVRRRRGGTERRDHLWAHAALWAVVGTALSLRPQVLWRGTTVTLPHLALARSWVPALDFIRVPERLAVSGWVGLALLAGLAFAELAPASRGRWTQALSAGLACVLAVAMYAQYARGLGQPAAYGLSPLPAVYPLQRMARGDSNILQVLRASEGPVIELPLDPSVPTHPAYQAAAMYRSIFHWRPLLNGYSSYWPREFPELMTLAARLPDPGALEELRRRTGLRLVLVRLTASLWNEARFEPVRQLWRGIGTRGDRADLELVGADDELLLFRVR